MGFKKTGDVKVIGQPKQYGELSEKEKKQNPKEKKSENIRRPK